MQGNKQKDNFNTTITGYRHANLNTVGLAYPIQCQRDDMMTPKYIFHITTAFDGRDLASAAANTFVQDFNVQQAMKHSSAYATVCISVTK